MYEQNEGNNPTHTKWTILHPIDSSHIDTTYFGEVVMDIGERSLLELMNTKLNNPHFEVKFDFDDVKGTLIREEFSDLALFYHDFTIPKPTQMMATVVEAIEEVFYVDQVTEGDETVTFRVSFVEGPYAHTIEETAYNINQVLGPEVESNVKQLGIDDYRMTFIIGRGYDENTLHHMFCI